MVEVPLTFVGDRTGRTLRFRALLVQDWEGDIILSWNVLDRMGVNFIRDRTTGKTTHITLNKVGDIMFPVSRRQGVKAAEVAKNLGAELERVVLGGEKQKLLDRITNGGPPDPKSEDRRDRSRRWKIEARTLRKTITPDSYRDLCIKANKLRWEKKSNESGLTKSALRDERRKAPVPKAGPASPDRSREEGGRRMKGKKRERDIESTGKYEHKYYNMHNNNNSNNNSYKICEEREGHKDNKHINIGYKRERQDGKTRRHGKEHDTPSNREAMSEPVDEKVRREIDEAGGWVASEELMRLLGGIGWREPPVVFARRNIDLMPRLRELERALVLVPWQDGASQILEGLDRLVEIPLLIPSSYLIRENGKPLRDKPWLVAQIDTPTKAEVWKMVHKRYFKEENRKEKIIDSMLRLWPPEVRIPERRDWASWELGERLYEVVKAAVVSVGEDFNSQELGAEENDDGLLDQALPLDIEEAARKDTYPTKQSLVKAMRDTSGGSIHGRIVDIAWAHRRVFDPVEPGSVKGHFHKIEFDTSWELKAKIYPLKPEH